MTYPRSDNMGKGTIKDTFLSFMAETMYNFEDCEITPENIESIANAIVENMKYNDMEFYEFISTHKYHGKHGFLMERGN